MSQDGKLVYKPQQVLQWHRQPPWLTLLQPKKKGPNLPQVTWNRSRIPSLNAAAMLYEE